jgi:diketogulonate reductase-like aldo/keto reductase
MSTTTTAVNTPIDYKALVADFAQAVAAPEASKSSMPTYKLASGYEMPVVAYGTFRANAGESYDAVLAAIREGYRHFDLAHIYGNEKEIGKAFAAAFEEGLVKRSDLFVTGKLWNSDHDVDVVPKACQHSLDNLGLEYFDLYLIHFPICWKHTGLSTPSWGESELGTIPLIDTWRAMEELVDAAKIRSIGVSNYPLMLLHDLVTQARIPVSCHQIETHVYYTRESLVNYCLSRNICVTAHTPLGGGKANEEWTKCPPPLEDPVVQSIASSKPGATPATILLRFLLQRGIVVLPKSVKPSRMKENIELFGPELTLTDDEMKQLAGLDKYISYKTNPNPITAFLGGPDAFTPEGTDIFD